MPPPASSTPDRVRAWYAHANALPARIADGDGWLTADERQRYGRFRADHDRGMFLVGRIMSRVLVGRALGIAPMAWQWREGPHGRPEIAAPTGSTQFNLAHSAGLVVCAIAEGRDVGVDVEDLDRRPVDRAVVARYCSAAEVDDIASHGDRWHDRFLAYWTLKEAYLKARGLGIAVALADITFSLEPVPRIAFAGSLAGTDTRWHFELAHPTARHLMAVAASTADGRPPALSLAPFDWSLTDAAP